MDDHWEPPAREHWCFEHCRMNLNKRYHLDITWQEYRRLCALLAYGVRKPIAYSWGKREVLIVWHGGKATKAIFCPEEGLLITFLPREAYESGTVDNHARRRDGKRYKPGNRPSKLRSKHKIRRENRRQILDCTEDD